MTMNDSTPSGKKTAPFSGYHNRPRPVEASPFTATGPDTPCGEYFRRFWHPFLLASELGTTPKVVRILGEDLVLFRDKSGRLGLLHKSCIHRGASLEFGVIDECGIKCCYHGWHFDVDGTVLATPAEPESSKLRSTFVQGAYAVREHAGLIFAYLGPPEFEPPFPIFDTTTFPADRQLMPFRLEYPCNWLQVVENACDPIHNVYLHAINNQQFDAAFAVNPVLDFIETPLGFLSSATRRVGNLVYTRSSDIIFPNVGQFIGGPVGPKSPKFHIAAVLTRWVTPVDDTHCFYLGYFNLNGMTNPAGMMKPEMFGVHKAGLIGQTGDRPYFDRQREPGDFDALASQGAVADRTNEHLGRTDRGIVMFRRLLGRAIREMQAGETPALPRLYDDGHVPTYVHEVAVEVDPASPIGDDESLLAFGREAARVVIETDHITNNEERTATAQRDLRIPVGEFVG
jgi:nitrite reductase/ring-hydroxylating ferredoxin subunit